MIQGSELEPEIIRYELYDDEWCVIAKKAAAKAAPARHIRRPELVLRSKAPHMTRMRIVGHAGFVVGLMGLTLAVAPLRALAVESDAARTPTLTLFGSEAEARAHCPGDTVAKVILPDGFFLHGDRGMGGTSLARIFVCRDEALGVFARPVSPGKTKP